MKSLESQSTLFFIGLYLDDELQVALKKVKLVHMYF